MTTAAPAAVAPASHAHRDDEAAKLGMYLFLFTELLLFGGMFLLYAVYRYAHPMEFHEAASRSQRADGSCQYRCAAHQQLDHGSLDCGDPAR